MNFSKFFIMCGPNVIENEEHTIKMARSLKQIFSNYDVDFIFKTSFDKANRSSLNSYRGLGFKEGLRILKRVKEEVGVSIITDIHENWQAKEISEVADIIQIPAFLCRQTDLLKAAAETGKIIHVKKGQMCSAEQMHKCKEKLIAFGNPNVILCERGNSFGYQDLVVDPRNLIWLQSNSNLVSMDITHCLQKPSQKMADGTVKSGGYRNLIPYMGKMAISLGVDGIFMEVHDNPETALCDGPTQWPLDRLEWLLNFLKIKKHKRFYNKKICFIPARYHSTRLPGKLLLKIDNKTIIKRVYEQVMKSKLIDDVIVLTDNENIKTHVESFGGSCKLVLEDCLNGTERIIKYIQQNLDCCDLVINVQGDEPFIEPENIDLMIQTYLDNTNPNVKCSTLHFKLHNNEVPNKSTGKIVLDENNYVLYCSRNIIPSGKNTSLIDNHQYFGHAGLFVYDKNYLLNDYIKNNTPLQLSEDIEWLKILEQGYKIVSSEVDFIERSVDTKDDYDFLVKKYN